MQPWEEDVVRWTARAVLANFFAASIARIAKGSACGPAWRVYRATWIMGAIFLVVHDVVAFAFAHNWSHAAALAHTAQRSEELVGLRAGWGLYLNYLMTALWCADAAWLASNTKSYQRRQRGIDAALFAFFGFLIFNATVVFATGPTRWMAVAGFAVLAVEWSMRRSVCGPSR